MDGGPGGGGRYYGVNVDEVPPWERGSVGCNGSVRRSGSIKRVSHDVCVGMLRVINAVGGEPLFCNSQERQVDWLHGSYWY